MWTRLLSRTLLMLTHCAILILVVISMIQVYELLTGIINQFEKGSRIPLGAALAVVLVPSGAMLCWALKAIVSQLITMSKLSAGFPD
jgi:hypothetical protein